MENMEKKLDCQILLHSDEEDEEDEEKKINRKRRLFFSQKFFLFFNQKLSFFLKDKDDQNNDKEDFFKPIDLFNDNKDESLTSKSDDINQTDIIKDLASDKIDDLDQSDYLNNPRKVEFLDELSQTGLLEETFNNQVNDLSHDYDNQISLEETPELIQDETNETVKSSVGYLESSQPQQKTSFSKEATFFKKQSNFVLEKLINQFHQTIFFEKLPKSAENRQVLDDDTSQRDIKYIKINKMEDYVHLLNQEINKRADLIESLEKKYQRLSKAMSPEIVKDQLSEIPEVNYSRKFSETSHEVNKNYSKDFLLSDKDYLNLAEKIKLEGISLKHFYLNKEISFNGLRRVVKEYLKGGNVEKYLQYELLERQKDFEKDPLLRDVRQEIEELTVKKATSIKKTQDLIDQSNDQLLDLKDSFKNQKNQSNQHQLSPTNLRLINLSLVGVIIFLISLIIGLLIVKL